jgi:hypothetical protein
METKIDGRKNKPIRLCSIPGCGKKHWGKGLCRLHFKRDAAGIDVDGGKAEPCIVCGAPTKGPRQKYCGAKCRMKWHRENGCYTAEKVLQSRGACSIEGCGKPVHSKRLCRAHSIRLWRNGDPVVVRRRKQSQQCKKCGEPSEGCAGNLCRRCYTMEFYYKNHERDRPRRNARRTYLEKITPRWADREAILRFYAACPDGHEVDHVIPIGTKRVCGLHVLENLQYLTPTANKQKHGRFDESFHKPGL